MLLTLSEKKYIYMIAIKNNKDPAKVYKNNLNVAYTLSSCPQIPIIKT